MRHVAISRTFLRNRVPRRFQVESDRRTLLKLAGNAERLSLAGAADTRLLAAYLCHSATSMRQLTSTVADHSLDGLQAITHARNPRPNGPVPTLFEMESSITG